jgi:hypothetical protein
MARAGDDEVEMLGVCEAWLPLAPNFRGRRLSKRIPICGETRCGS